MQTHITPRSPPHRTPSHLTCRDSRHSPVGCGQLLPCRCWGLCCCGEGAAGCRVSSNYAEPDSTAPHRDTSPPTAPIATPPPHPSHSTTPKTERHAPAVTPSTRRLAAAGCCRVAAGVCAACHNSTLAKCNSSNSHAQPYPQHHDTSPPTAPIATPPPHPSHSTTPKTERHRTCRDSRHTPVGCCRLLPRRCRGLCCLWGRSGWVPCATACCCPPSPVGRIAALRCCQDCARHCAALTLQSQHSNSIMRMGVLVR
jgi:hypothetical protein